MNNHQLVKQLEQALISQQIGLDASHDLHHARRVLSNALHIAEREPTANKTIITAAAYLHDLVNVPKNAPNRHLASRLSAEAAMPVLRELAFNNDDIQAIAHCIEAHSFSANIKPDTIDAKIVQDADRLESVGALGIARTFYIGGKLESMLFHAADPFAENRVLNDRQFAVDHFKVKLLGLSETMQTQSGKRIAEQRTQHMIGFLNQLAEELDVAQPW